MVFYGPFFSNWNSDSFSLGHRKQMCRIPEGGGRNKELTKFYGRLCVILNFNKLQRSLKML